MDKNNLTVHMVVKNEDRFVWYSIASILPFTDKVLITDTGSSDKTVELIESFEDRKICFRQKSISDPKEIASLRQEQIEKTLTDWFWIVDGDEVYSKSLCQEIIEIIETVGNNLEGIVVGRYDLLGDIYHYQDESVGAYNLFGKKGHFAIRLINKRNIPGLHVKGNYPFEGYYDSSGIEIINHEASKFFFTKKKLFHAMYLHRSSLGCNLPDTFHRSKWKIELGKKFSENISFPEVFNMPYPSFVSKVTNKRSLFYVLLAILVTPIKIIKRKIWKIMNIFNK